eukprot:10012-Heterococcus_DN1.PRE.2
MISAALLLRREHDTTVSSVVPAVTAISSMKDLLSVLVATAAALRSSSHRGYSDCWYHHITAADDATVHTQLQALLRDCYSNSSNCIVHFQSKFFNV